MMTEGGYQFLVGCYLIFIAGTSIAILVLAIKAAIKTFKKEE